MHFYALRSTNCIVSYSICNIILLSIRRKCPLTEVVVPCLWFWYSSLSPAGEEVIGHCSSKNTASHFYRALFWRASLNLSQHQTGISLYHGGVCFVFLILKNQLCFQGCVFRDSPSLSAPLPCSLPMLVNRSCPSRLVSLVSSYSSFCTTRHKSEFIWSHFVHNHNLSSSLLQISHQDLWLHPDGRCGWWRQIGN